MNKTVLFIVHDFPPAGGPGVQRGLKFAKFLPEFGWRAAVITATPDSYVTIDETLTADIPADTPISRVRSFEPNRHRPIFERFHLGKALSLINAAMFLPDAALVWAIRSRAAVRDAVGSYRPSAIFSSALPGSAHLLGLWAHRTTGLPWIADFRDPWSESQLLPYLPGYRSINRRMESRVIAEADRITVVSSPLQEMYRRLVQDRSKVVLIENGYDESDVERLPPPRTDRFTVAYTGEFSRIRRPDAFVAAIDGLVASGQIPPEQLRVVFAGQDTARFIPDRPPFVQLGYLPHHSLNQVRRDSDLLLLLLEDRPQNRGMYSGKVFEYLACNRPTLVIAGADNVAAQLVTRVRAGSATDHNADQIAQALLGYYRRWRAGVFDHDPDWDAIGRFSRRNLTGILARELDRLTNDT